MCFWGPREDLGFLGGVLGEFLGSSECFFAFLRCVFWGSWVGFFGFSGFLDVFWGCFCILGCVSGGVSGFPGVVSGVPVCFGVPHCGFGAQGTASSEVTATEAMSTLVTYVEPVKFKSFQTAQSEDSGEFAGLGGVLGVLGGSVGCRRADPRLIWG